MPLTVSTSEVAPADRGEYLHSVVGKLYFSCAWGRRLPPPASTRAT